MQETAMWIVGIVLFIPVVYVFVRVGAVAYYRTRLEHLRRVRQIAEGGDSIDGTSH